MTNRLLNIDTLRSYEVEPAYFGLGFIQLKIKRNARVHFYHTELPVLTEEPHNHRYYFISYILQGRFQQELYAFKSSLDGTHLMTAEDCKPGTNTLGSSTIGDLTNIFSAEYQAGDYYEISADTLHTVRGYDNAITYLVRHEPIKQYASVVRAIGAEKVCPFSQPISTNRCWDLIEDMLPQ